MNAATNDGATEAVLAGDEMDQVGGGNENSHSAGQQMGAALGGLYQGAVDYVSTVVFPYWLD